MAENVRMRGRDEVVEAVRRCGMWIEREAENIVGDQVLDVVDGGIKVSFEISRSEALHIVVERTHACLEAMEVFYG